MARTDDEGDGDGEEEEQDQQQGRHLPQGKVCGVLFGSFFMFITLFRPLPH